MDTLKDIVRREVGEYAGRMLNGISYLTVNKTEDVFVVVSIAKWKGEHIASSDMIVRLVNDLVVIEQDNNNKPLVDALVQAGIPREKIILTYAGETLPEPEVYAR